MTVGVARLMTIAIATGLLTLLGAAPAASHSQLTGSSPRAGSELSRAPKQVRLEFNEPISPEFAQITLIRGDEDTEQLAPRVDIQVVTAAVPAAPANLSEREIPWRVNYRVVSADGHPVTGTIDFTAPGRVPQPTPTSPSPVAPSVSAVIPSGSPETQVGAATDARQDDGGDSGLLPLVAALLFALVVGALVMLIRRRREGPGE